MKSMTGYGRGESVRDGLKVIAELSSVNRKQAEIAVNLPRELEMLDAPLRDLVHRHIARGRLTGRVTLHTTNGTATAHRRINVSLARAYARELAQLARQLKLAGPVTLDHLVRAPGVFQTDTDLAAAEDLWPAVQQAVRQALVALVKMREREGAHLEKDLVARIRIMRRCVARVRTQAPGRRRGIGRNSWSGLKAPDCPHPRRMMNGCLRKWCCSLIGRIFPRN